MHHPYLERGDAHMPSRDNWSEGTVLLHQGGTTIEEVAKAGGRRSDSLSFCIGGKVEWRPWVEDAILAATGSQELVEQVRAAQRRDRIVFLTAELESLGVSA